MNRKKTQFGERSSGQDNNVYKSRMEREFCDRFLYRRFEYEYEKSYGPDRRFKCDFYLPKFDLYLELVPFERCGYMPRYLIGNENVYLKPPDPRRGYNRIFLNEYNIGFDRQRCRFYIPSNRINEKPLLFWKNIEKHFEDNMVETVFFCAGFNDPDKNVGDFQKEYVQSLQEKMDYAKSLGKIICTVSPSDLRQVSLISILNKKGMMDKHTFIVSMYEQRGNTLQLQNE